jgi:hypothetical protein
MDAKARKEPRSPSTERHWCSRPEKHTSVSSNAASTAWPIVKTYVEVIVFDRVQERPQVVLRNPAPLCRIHHQLVCDGALSNGRADTPRDVYQREVSLAASAQPPNVCLTF